MLPDLRLLIPATVATFFLAAAAGLYASVRLVQDPFSADARAAADDSPINRIVTGWPRPEPNRTAALRELAVLLKENAPAATPASLAPASTQTDAPAQPGAALAGDPASASVHAKDAAAPSQVTSLPVTPDETLKAEPAAPPSGAEMVPESGAITKSAEPAAQRPVRTVRRRAQPGASAPEQQSFAAIERAEVPAN
ncbi:MAG: hypothetical protein F9K38_12865 [Pseudorhodoplanes sp.]|nr:MAG: hypothetical protein F9K38_12865 [Pseudorhodoplanes sp.]